MQVINNWSVPFSRYNVMAEELNRLINHQKSIENLPKTYLEALNTDMPRLIDILVNISAIQNEFNHLSKRIIDDNLQVSAFTFLGLKKRANYVVSIGFLMALDDLFFRLCTNSDFFSHDFSLNKKAGKYGAKLWHGTKCIWLHKAGMIVPHTRFYDYRQQGRLERAYLKTDLGKAGELPTFLSGFYHVVPFQDQSRIELAALMVYIGLLWVLLHEEGHYWEGHLHFKLHQNMGKASVNEVEDQHDNDTLIMLYKVFEWEADRHAISGVIDVMMRKNAFPFSLPPYCKDAYWKLRAIMTSVGAVTLIFERARQLYGSAKNYPSPRTRCLAALFGCLNRIQNSNFPFFHKFEFHEMLSAFTGSLYDLMVAADLLPQEEDLVDRGIGFHKYYGKHRTPQQMNFIENEKEILDILNCVLLQNNSNVEISEEIKRKWLLELEQVVNQHDKVVYDMLAPYRKMAKRQK